jgi:hypothetical protein
MQDGKIAIRMGLVALLALVGVVLALVVLTAPAHAIITGDAPPSSGDWKVNQETWVKSEPNVRVYGNAIINSVLHIQNSTVYMALTMDNQYMINVTATGNLKANNSRITALNTNYEYGFYVYGKMALLKMVVEETFNGVQVLTEKTVTIESTDIIMSYGTALYLYNANDTTLKNVFVQTNEAIVTATGRLEGRSYYDNPTMTVSAGGGALYIKGGTPKIENLNASVNGTMEVTVRVDDYYGWGVTYRANLLFPLIGIDSKDIKEVSGINVRDSTVDFKIVYNCYFTNYYTYIYVYNYYYASAVNVLNYGDVGLKNCNAVNVKVGSTSASYSLKQPVSYNYVYMSNYNQGMKLFAATINAKFHDAGPHQFKLTLKDMTFDNVGVLQTTMSPDYDGTQQPTFESTVIIDHVTINRGSNPFVFTTGPQFSLVKTFKNDYRITNCTFTNMTGPAASWTWSGGPGIDANKRTFELYEDLTFDHCLFRWNKVGSSGFFYENIGYRYEYNNVYDNNVIVKNCRFLDNQGCFAYLYGNYYTTRGNEEFTFLNNYVYNNTGTNNYFFYMYFLDRITFRDNWFESNTYVYGIYCMDYGGDYNGKKLDLWVFDNNTFRNTKVTNTYDYNKGTIYVMWGGTVEVTDNNVSDVDVCFLNLYEYAYYAGVANVEVKGNYFTHNNGTFVYFYGYYDYHTALVAEIDENYAIDNNGPFTTYYEQASYMEQYDFDGTIYFRNNTVINTNGTVYNNWGRLTITGNTFKDCVGYVIYLKYLYTNPPVIKDNVIQNCQNVYNIQAKAKGALKMSLSIKDLFVDCTGNAFYFKNLEVTMEHVEVTQRADVAIIAENSNVDATEGSNIPIGSGEVIGEGSITVWYKMELFVYWSNATVPDVSSGQPVSEALVVFYSSTGVYYTSEYTDALGHLKPFRVPQWNIRGSFLTVWTPFSLTVAKAGVTAKGSVDLYKDYVGADAFNFLLVDTYIPAIRITSPFPRDVFAKENLTVLGFTTEVGSGIKKVEVYFTDAQGHDLKPVLVTVDQNGDFLNTFTQMPEGDNIVIHADVWDVALNFNHTEVSVLIDRTAPTIGINTPKEGDVFNVARIFILGTYEPGAKIRVNGLERPGPYTGILNEEFTLSEGNNTIAVEAVDMAGNIGAVSRNVRLDRFAPTLTVLEPRDGLITKVTNITIEGDVEEGARITVSVYRTTLDLINETITPKLDGTFTHKVNLAEGANRIVVRAWDDARNLAEIERVVIVDTMAPSCEITSPKDGTITNQNTVRVLGRADTGSTLYLNGKQIYNDGTVDRVVSLNEGLNTIELRTVDVIGNEYRHRVKVTLDTKAPVIVMTRPLVEFLKTNRAELDVAGTVTGANTLMVMGEPVAISGDPAPFSALVHLAADGLNEVVIEAIDVAGNRATYTISVDFSTLMPILNLVYQPSITNIESSDANLYITGSTTVGIKEITISHTFTKDGVSRTETNAYPVDEFGQFTVARILSEGSNKVGVKVTDSYGNTNQTSDYQVTYKYAAPPVKGPEPARINPGAIAGIVLAVSIALLVTAVVVTRSFRARD